MASRIKGITVEIGGDMIADVTLNGVSMFGLGWLRESIDFPTPQSQTNTIVVPGRNSPIRFTEALGRVSYQPRSFSITLSMLGMREKFNAMSEVLANRYAGQLTKVILREEPGFSYKGTLIGLLEYFLSVHNATVGKKAVYSRQGHGHG